MEWYTSRTANGNEELIISFNNEKEKACFMNAVKVAVAAGAEQDSELRDMDEGVPETGFHRAESLAETEIFRESSEDFALKLQYYINRLNETASKDVFTAEEHQENISELRKCAEAIQEEFRELSKAYYAFKSGCRKLFEAQVRKQEETLKALAKQTDMIHQYEALLLTHAENAYLPKEYKENNRVLLAYHNMEWKDKINKIKALRKKKEESDKPWWYYENDED